MKQLAVIKSGGKQYLVFPGKKIRVEKLDKKEGEKIEFDVLLLKDEKGVRLGCPLVEGAKVEGRVLKQGKSKKVVVFKRKTKKRYQVKRGHRQLYTEVEITKIS
ncbi:50S ribosomal protein L21 [bacterium]|nr:50S ribosomal protein L21 [bacterium]